MSMTPDTPPPANAATPRGAAHDAAQATAAVRGGAVASGAPPGSDAATDAAERTGAGAAAGMAAGVQAGALVGTLGAATFGLGGLAGAALGLVIGAAAGGMAAPGQGGFSADEDAYYRALYGAVPAAGRSYDDVRTAYVFGHLAAAEPGLAGLTFEEAEPALREAWTDELRARVGAWDQVRGYVCDAYGHARAEGAGERRDPTVIGSAGSAVDPVELDRARHGLPSVPGSSPGDPEAA